jgi:membrane protein
MTQRRDYAPAGTDSKPTTPSTLKRAVTELSEDNMTDWAAALTYYGVLSMFPALIAMVSIVGLFGDPTSVTKTLTDIVSSVGPSSAADALKGPIASVTSNKGGAGIALIFGILGALWSASGYVGGFMRASQIIWETPEGRPIWKLRPLQMLVTLVMVILAALVALSLVLTGPVVDSVAGPLGFGSTAVTIWNIAKWPVLVVVVLGMICLLYYSTPNVRLRGLRSVLKGAIAALVVWLIASVAFAFFVANFGSYNKTYGTLGGVVAFLVWLWITNVALLFGAELNSEQERTIELREGRPRADREIQLDARDEPKEQRTT